MVKINDTIVSNATVKIYSKIYSKLEVPVGTIIYSATRPDDGWYLCDGTNNTPDLRESRLFGGAVAGTSANDAFISHTHNQYWPEQYSYAGFIKTGYGSASSTTVYRSSFYQPSQDVTSGNPTANGASYTRSNTYYTNFWIYLGA